MRLTDIARMRVQYDTARKAMQQSFKEHTIKMLTINGASSVEIASIIGEKPQSVRNTLSRLRKEAK